MTTWHGYIAIEDIALTNDQRAAVLAAFRTLGPENDSNPARLNHRRVSLDGSKAIYEAAFNDATLTVASAKQFLANAVGVSAAIINDTVQQTARGPLVTFSVAGMDRMRFLVFAGINSTWEASHTEVLAYLAANLAAWETV